MQPDLIFLVDEWKVTIVLTLSVIWFDMLSSIFPTSHPLTSVLDIKTFILHWLWSNITPDNHDKVGGSFRSSKMEEVAFNEGSMNAVVIL